MMCNAQHEEIVQPVLGVCFGLGLFLGSVGMGGRFGGMLDGIG